MLAAQIPENEKQRLNALYNYHILNSVADIAFNEVVELTAEVCAAPIALITLVDESRQWFKAKVGLDIEQTERSIAFCAHAILKNNILVVNDTLDDERFFDNPLVTKFPFIRFYAGAPLITDEGCGLGTLCVIDQRPRQLEISQLKALSVLRTHVMTLLKMRKQAFELKSLNEELDAFSAAASHDMVAPARRIAEFSQILLDEYADNLDTEATDIVERIRGSSLNMKDLVESLLDMSRIARVEIQYERVSLSSIAHDFLLDLTQSSPRRVHFEIEPDVSVFADRTLMRIVMENLLSNAWKFTANNSISNIKMYTQLRNGVRWISLQDDGVGFDMDFSHKLFIPFQRLHRQEEFKGSGVGLTTVQRILHRHGGEINISSRPNQGTTVSFTLG